MSFFSPCLLSGLPEAVSPPFYTLEVGFKVCLVNKENPLRE